MSDALYSLIHAIASAFVSSRLGEAELLVALLVAMCLVVFAFRGRDVAHR